MTISDNFSDIGGLLADFLDKNKTFFLKCDPEIIDFRNEYFGNILLFGEKDIIKFNIPTKSLATFLGIITCGVFGANNTVYTWDIKRLFSYFSFRLKHKIDVLSRIIDIKYGEAFLDLTGECPNSYEEAHRRAKVIINDDRCWHIHHGIHIPLATRVLPKIETYGLLDTEDKITRYTSYDIEGQTNGRLRCREAFPNGLLVHNLQKQDKAKLKSRYDNKLVVMDFRSMETCVLQWLSGDRRLGKIISSGKDIYSTIYSLLYNSVKCTEEQRQFIKRTFLPVVYGLQANSMSLSLGISHEESRNIISGIRKYFAEAMEWIESSHKGDHFGRVRVQSGCSGRNAVVQGPAAIVCLEKLIALFDVIPSVVASIHDCYVLDVCKDVLDETIMKAVKVLEKPSEFLPNLTLRVDVKVGDDFENTIKYQNLRANE